ncbi:hypothetical protein EDC56_3270 [Sinobacterium caligoides]|uniref:Putative membrane protein insertion efficiency factor n=1 Tax=Sinobacterium caligoides TaxID=933926 RepID=A0A3N2DGV7_9GAMM|nr:membrane protein insertion efficiency factor YidD [Sinobacterium caligoides]ROR99030.1 hypothetical protein EDC56_3270 [Sinobacterium caligoides]
MKSLALLIIRCYRYFISPLLGPRCRFYPTCSEYASQAIVDHGVLKGSFLTIKRLLRCHPFHEGGCDPVPQVECSTTKDNPTLNSSTDPNSL